MIMKGAEPFLLPGGPQGVLLIHGFTGAPAEMRLWGEYLQQAGFTVLGIRLAGHGTTPEDLARMCWQDWVDSVCDGYDLLRGMCQEISAGGLSMGALLAIYLSTKRPVHRLVSVSAPIFIDENRQVGLLPPREACTGEFIPKRRKPLPGVAPCYNITYRQMPLLSVHELLDFIVCAKQALPKVTTPLLVIQGRQDHTVQPRSAEYIYEQAGSVHKQLYWLEKSGHLATIDCERMRVFEETKNFFADEENE